MLEGACEQIRANFDGKKPHRLISGIVIRETLKKLSSDLSVVR
jgi:hypothetical protein